MKTPKGPQSGKRGKVVASRNHFGSYEREHTSPKKDRTPAQQRTTAGFGVISKVWSQLTEAQRLAWMAEARHSKSRSRLGESYSLTGQTYFMRVNNLRAGFGLGPLTDPPPRGQHIPNPVRALIITNQGGRIALKLELAEPPLGDIMVFGAAPCSAGAYRCFKCLRLGPLPAPVGRLSEITSLYVKRHGVPPVGKRVFIRIRPQDDGPRDRYLELHAVVPSRQSGRSQASGA
jgi:hypothetical protein